MLKVLGAGGAAGLAGCTGDGDGGDETTTTTTATTTTTESGDGDGDGDGDTTTTTETDTTTTEEEDQGPREPQGTFIAGSTSTADPPHPLRGSTDATTSARLDKLFDGPGGVLGPRSFMPLWFESWEINDSFDEVTYKLRDGLTWGAGYGQLDAEDYMYYLDNIVLTAGEDDWYGYTYSQFFQLGPDQEFVEFEQVDDLTLRATLPVSKPQYLHEDTMIYELPVPKDLLQPYVEKAEEAKQLDDEEEKQNIFQEAREGLDQDPDLIEAKIAQGECNLGPYTFVEWERGSQWQYERNENYYLKDYADDPAFSDPFYDFRNSPYFEEYRYQSFSEQSTMLSALQTGEVHTAGIPSEKIEQYRGRDDVNLWESKFGSGHFWLNLNHRRNSWTPLRTSRKVRQAMAELYDPDTIVEDINNGNAVPMHTFHPRWGPYHPPQDRLYRPEGSIDKAKQLLEEGTSSQYGYDDRDRFIGPDGEQVTLKSVRTTGSETTEISAQHMKQRLSEAGIGLEIEAAQWQTLLRNYAINSARNVDDVDRADWSIGPFNGGPWNQSTSAADWSLMFGLGFSASPYSPWSTIKSTFSEQGTFNLWGYHQNQFDIVETVDAASTAPNPQVTQQEMSELFAFLSRDMPVVWTFSEYVVTGYRPQVEHFPGERTDDGWRATSYFKSPDTGRLNSFAQE